MKRIVIFIFFFLLGQVFFVTPVLGQTSDAYLLKRDNYFAAYNEYLSAKQSYKNQQTLQKEEILSSKLVVFLIARSEFLEEYFKVIIPIGKQFLSQTEIDKVERWLVWLNENRKKIDPDSSLQEIVAVGKELAVIYPEMERDIYFFLVKLTIVQQEVAMKKMETIFIFDGEEKLVERWLAGVRVKNEAIYKAHQAAVKAMESAYIYKKGDILSGWRKAKNNLISAQSYLEESLVLINEILVNLEK